MRGRPFRCRMGRRGIRLIMKKKSIYLKIWGLMAALLLVGTACQSQSKEAENGEGAGVLNEVTSIDEMLGTVVPTAPPMPTLDPDVVAVGEEIYAQHCAVCHGVNLEGAADWQTQNEDGSFRPPPHDETGHTWHHSDRVLIEAIKLGGARLPDNIGGSSNMPAFGEVLSEEEITAVLTYIKSSWPDDIRQMQWNNSASDPLATGS